MAAFAGLTVGLLVLKMTRQHANARIPETGCPTLMLAPRPASPGRLPHPAADLASSRHARQPGGLAGHLNSTEPDPGLLRAARAIYQDAAARGERLSQRRLARLLRGHGHRFPNERLRLIADSIGLTANRAA